MASERELERDVPARCRHLLQFPAPL